MLSKRSSFNPTLFRKNLSRFWPLWGGFTAVGSLLPLYTLLALLQNGSQNMQADDFAYGLYSLATNFVPTITFIYAVLVAMLVWGYLFNSRAAGMMHTLPIDRDGLFLTNTLSGFFMLLIPYVVVGGLTCLLAVCWGFFSLLPVVNTVVSVVLINIAFFGIATFCAMLTGNLFALPALYLALHFAVPAVEALLRELAGLFLLGITGSTCSAVAMWLSPILQIVDKFCYYRVDNVQGIQTLELRGMHTIIVYGLVGLVLLGLSRLLYRIRHIEKAGDVIVFPSLKPLVRFALAMLSALTAGFLLYTIFWGALFQTGDYADVLPAALCLAAGALIGYYAAAMLLEKTLRVFRKNWIGAAAACAAAALLCLGLSVDLFGTERYIPPTEKIETLYFSCSGFSDDCTMEDNPQLIDTLTQLHRAIISERNYIRQVEHPPYRLASGAWEYIHFRYTLSNSSQVYRSYRLPLTQQRAAQPGTYDHMLLTLYEGPAIAEMELSVPEEYLLMLCYIHGQSDDKDFSRDFIEEDAQRLYQALLTDARQGNIPNYDPFTGTPESYPLSISMEFRTQSVKEHGNYGYQHRNSSVYPHMTNTISLLMELEVIDEEDVTRWNEEIAQSASSSEKN